MARNKKTIFIIILIIVSLVTRREQKTAEKTEKSHKHTPHFWTVYPSACLNGMKESLKYRNKTFTAHLKLFILTEIFILPVLIYLSFSLFNAGDTIFYIRNPFPIPYFLPFKPLKSISDQLQEIRRKNLLNYNSKHVALNVGNYRQYIIDL